MRNVFELRNVVGRVPAVLLEQRKCNVELVARMRRVQRSQLLVNEFPSLLLGSSVFYSGDSFNVLVLDRLTEDRKGCVWEGEMGQGER